MDFLGFYNGDHYPSVAFTGTAGQGTTAKVNGKWTVLI